MAVNFDVDGILAKVRAAAMAGVINAAEIVREEAIRTITQEAKTGRIYYRGANGRRHQASAPGEAPASDTSRLVNSIDVRPDVGDVRAVVNAGTGYAAGLEFGTAKMAPRPFMRPALAAKRAEIEQTVQDAVSEALK